MPIGGRGRALAVAALFASMGSTGAFVVTRGALTSVPTKLAVSSFSLRSRPGLPVTRVIRRGNGLLGMKATAAVAATEDGSVGMISDVSEWHRQRNKAIREAHPEIKELEGSDSKSLLLLLACNAVLLACTLAAASLSVPAVLLLGVTVASTASLWQMTLLHEVVHGNMVR
ncbi:hypothetical protein T484DRAFT_1840931 [Baffinella frigidus]|nr:hypothetical protein T484DRAFT_1840931 [Cryptophyta sp. CCMP2293]